MFLLPYLNVLAILGSLLVGLVVGTWAGAKMRGMVPLRMPPNGTRLENAKTDAEIKLLSARTAKDAEQVDLERKEIEYRARATDIEAERRILNLQGELEHDRLELVEDNEAEAKVLLGLSDGEIGDIVRTERVQRGWRQIELAEHAGITQRRLAEIESGRGYRSNDLRRVAAALHLTLRKPHLEPAPAHRPPADVASAPLP